MDKDCSKAPVKTPGCRRVSPGHRRQPALSCGALLCSAVLGVLVLTGQAAEIAGGEDKNGYRFTIGNAGDKGPAATVAVEQVLPPEKKRTLIRLSKEPLPVVRGIAVRFEQVEAAALDELPAAVQALAKTPRFQMQRVAFFAPGDPVPRLMAEEAVVRAPGEWLLKGVLLSDRPSERECRLVWNKGVAKLAFPKGKTLGFDDLLAVREPR